MSAAQAYSSLTEQIRQEFSNELYPIKSLLPGYRRPRSNAPKFVVAEFRVSDDDMHVWSQAIGEILTYRIQYVPGVRLYMPASYNNLDAAWLEPMQKLHVVDLDNWHDRLGTSPVEIFIKEILDHPNGKFIGAVVIILILVMVYQMGRRST
ncbi:MAG: hypothetical protein GY875_25610 [Gammaproteobacteria bacterium]|nr:hypothetical protein [Gammaproteobacteria bacterium]